MKYSVMFIKKDLIKEDFEINKDNMVDLYIQNKYGQNVTEQYKIVACLSKDAMLGLGKSLIRRATGYYERGDPMQIMPARKGHTMFAYGICLHPQSIETIIGDNSIETSTQYTHSNVSDSEKTMTYEFELECPKTGVFEDFEKNDTNVACFQVFDLEGNNISDQIRYVGLWFVKNSLIGFGTELIRLAHNFEEGKEIHIVPKSKKSEVQQAMGIYLSPNSCELILKCKSFESIDKILEEYNKEHVKP
jgi:hypothetical protein